MVFSWQNVFLFYTVVPILIVAVCAGPGYKFYYQESKSGLYVIMYTCSSTKDTQQMLSCTHTYCFFTYLTGISYSLNSANFIGGHAPRPHISGSCCMFTQAIVTQSLQI